MDIVEKRRADQKIYNRWYKFIMKQRKWFLEAHEKALEKKATEQKKAKEHVTSFILSFH